MWTTSLCPNGTEWQSRTARDVSGSANSAEISSPDQRGVSHDDSKDDRATVPACRRRSGGRPLVKERNIDRCLRPQREPRHEFRSRGAKRRRRSAATVGAILHGGGQGRGERRIDPVRGRLVRPAVSNAFGADGPRSRRCSRRSSCARTRATYCDRRRDPRRRGCGSDPRRAEPPGALEQFWNPLLASDSPALLCVGGV